MADVKRISTPLTPEVVSSLKAGDQVAVTGVIYTARDPAHKKLVEALREGKALPFDVRGQIIFYGGPCPAKPGFVIGSCGPTSSFRMDPYTPQLLELGLKGIVGKGPRSEMVIESMIKNKAVYFAAIGGTAAVIAHTIKKAEIVAYADLGTDAIRRLEVVEFPCFVVTDAEGNDLYKGGVEKYRRD